MARLKRQRVGASVFTDSTGYHGDNLAQHPDTFAELGSGGGAIGDALGKLPYGKAVRVTNPKTGKSLVLRKRDIGLGGGAVSGKHRSIDLYGPAARKLGIDGLGVVEISEVSDTSAPASAAAAPQAQAATALTPELAARRAAILESLVSRRHPNSPLVQLGVISKALDGQAAATPAAAAQPAAQPKAQATKRPELDQTGTAVFEGTRVAAWIKPILDYARQNGWKGKLASGWRSRAKQEYLYAHPQGYPVAKPGTSMHEQARPGWGAVDVDQGSAPQLARILERSPYKNKLKWAGSKDRVHFSGVHGGRY